MVYSTPVTQQEVVIVPIFEEIEPVSNDPKGVWFEPRFWKDTMEEVKIIRIEVGTIREC